MRLVWSVPGRAKNLLQEAVAAARQADVVVLAMGLSPRLEGEEMRVPVEGFEGGDRLTLGLPPVQEELMQRIAALGKPTALVLLNGSAVAVNWAADRVPAIVEAWYPGQAGGTAVADVLFGDYNPAGRLPVTFYTSVEQLPPFEDYNMAGRTYRYFKGTPLYPFGFGLSYTTFRYGDLQLPKEVPAGENVKVSAIVENIGKVSGEEVVQLYVSDTEASVPVPIRSLQGFRRISLAPGAKETVEFTLAPKQLSMIDQGNRRVVEPGVFEISVGGKQPGFRGRQDAASTGVITGRLSITGETKVVE
jgi:beta-glucosidase